MSARVRSYERVSPLVFNLVLWDRDSGEYAMNGFTHRTDDESAAALGRVLGLRARNVYQLRDAVCRASDGR